MENKTRKYHRISASMSQEVIDDLKFEALKKRTTVSRLLEEILREAYAAFIRNIELND